MYTKNGNPHVMALVRGKKSRGKKEKTGMRGKERKMSACVFLKISIKTYGKLIDRMGTLVTNSHGRYFCTPKTEPVREKKKR